LLFSLLQSTVRSVHVPAHAGVAQLVERLIRNQQVRGSSPRAGSNSLVNQEIHSSSQKEAATGLPRNCGSVANAALDSECVVPSPIPPETLGEFVLSGEDDDERAHIRGYVERQAHQEVKHVERIKAERIFGREYEVWDVHSDESRWWVITPPTNLYSQELFRSADYTLSFHVGLMARIDARRETPAAGAELERSLVAWRRWEQAHEAMQRGDEAEDFQAVGMRCRECLLEMVRSLVSPAMVPAGTAAPKIADFANWCDLIVGHVVPGSSSDELRRHLRAVAKSTWQYVNWLTHAQNAVGFDARIAVDSTAQVLNAFGAAVIRSERGVPDRCPSCQSYQVESIYDPESESASLYRSVCRSCGWSERSDTGLTTQR
jgi:uncharacterized protein CbrC (UPF0167 family)